MTDPTIPEGRAEPWQLMMMCKCHGAAPCTNTSCVRVAKKRWREILNAPTLLAAARLTHYKCDVWAQSRHGGMYVKMAERYCGKDALRHIVCIANKPWLIEAWSAVRAEQPALRPVLFELEEAA